MKSLLVYFVTLATFLSTASFAQDKPKAADFSKVVRGVEYSVKTILNEVAIKDLAQLSAAATRGIDYKIAGDITEIFFTATELLQVIAEDRTLTKEQKRPLINELGSSLGELYLKIIRHNGDDSEKVEMEPGNKWSHLAITSGKELLRTFSDPVMLETTANNTKVNKIKERLIRDWLGQKVTIEFQRLVKTMGEINDEKADDVIRRMLAVPKQEILTNTQLNRYGVYVENGQIVDGVGVARRALFIRNSRKNAHYATFGVIGAMAAVWAGAPVDFAGGFMGYDAAISPLVSDIVAGSVLSLLTATKWVTGSFSTMASIRKLIDFVENPASQAELSTLKESLLSRLLRIDKKIQAQVAGLPQGSESKRKKKGSLGLNSCLAHYVTQ